MGLKEQVKNKKSKTKKFLRMTLDCIALPVGQYPLLKMIKMEVGKENCHQDIIVETRIIVADKRPPEQIGNSNRGQKKAKKNRSLPL